MFSGKNTLAVDTPCAGNPEPYAFGVPVCEQRLLCESLIREGLGEEGAGCWRMREVGALALVAGLEVSELAGLVAVSRRSTEWGAFV